MAYTSFHRNCVIHVPMKEWLTSFDLPMDAHNLIGNLGYAILVNADFAHLLPNRSSRTPTQQVDCHNLIGNGRHHPRFNRRQKTLDPERVIGHDQLEIHWKATDSKLPRFNIRTVIFIQYLWNFGGYLWRDSAHFPDATDWWPSEKHSLGPNPKHASPLACSKVFLA